MSDIKLPEIKADQTQILIVQFLHYKVLIAGCYYEYFMKELLLKCSLERLDVI